MSIIKTIDLHDAPTRTIEPWKSSKDFPDKDHSVVPYDSAHIARAAFQAYDEGYLDEVPWALDAYLSHDQHKDGR